MKSFIFILTILAIFVGCSKTETPLDRMESRFSDGEYQQAIAACDAILSSSSEPTELQRSRMLKGQSYLALASIAKEKENKEDAERYANLAIDQFTKAIESDAKDFNAYHCRSDAYQLLGDETAALNDAKVAREMDPAYGVAYTNELRRKPVDLREIDKTIEQVIGADAIADEVENDQVSRTASNRRGSELTTEETNQTHETHVTTQTSEETDEEKDTSLTGLQKRQLTAKVESPSLKQETAKTEKTSSSQEETSPENAGDSDEPESMEEAENARPIVSRPLVPPSPWRQTTTRQPTSPTQISTPPKPATGFVNDASRAYNPFPNYPTTGYSPPARNTQTTQVPPSAGAKVNTNVGYGKIVTQNLPTGTIQFTGAMPFKHRPALGGSSDKKSYLTPAQPIINNQVPAYTPNQIKPLEPTPLRQRPPVYYQQ